MKFLQQLQRKIIFEAYEILAFNSNYSKIRDFLCHLCQKIVKFTLKFTSKKTKKIGALKQIIPFSKVSFIFMVILFNFISINSFAKTSHNLTIFSESNMAYALTEIARSYSKQDNIIVSVDFNSSLELIQNIDFGEPADIFISSHADWIEILKQKGLVDVYNLINIAKDKLVIITSDKNSRINKFDSQAIKNATDIGAILKIINDKKIPLIIDSQYSSLGRYTNKIIKEANIVNHRIFHKVYEDKKSIIDFINEYNDYCGIVLKSEVQKQDNIKILAEIPNMDIYYQALVIAGDNMEKAREFLKFLKSYKTQRILKDNGFINLS